MEFLAQSTFRQCLARNLRRTARCSFLVGKGKELIKHLAVVDQRTSGWTGRWSVGRADVQRCWLHAATAQAVISTDLLIQT